VIVAASTDCFPELSLAAALDRLNDLEYTSVELALNEHGRQLKPSQVVADFDAALLACRQTRLTTVALDITLGPSPESQAEEYYRQFHACCLLAKALKIVVLAVPAAELGTPFNAEIERLRRLVSIGTMEGVVVALKTQIGCLTEDPDTAVVLCDNVKGLALTLDPSHYVYGPHQGGKYHHVMKHVAHMHLRDTSKTQFQVRVGQGQIEYGKLIAQLEKFSYRRALSVNVLPMDDVDQNAELRKMRLLLESLI
jgi:sugar phosphate isomerase/epimerase